MSAAKVPTRKPRGRFLALLFVASVVMCGRSVWRMRDVGSGHQGGKGGHAAPADLHLGASKEEKSKETDDEGTAITDHPAPKAANAEAAAAYASALQHVRDASMAGAAEDFIRAARLDPTLAAAHLRVVLYDTGVIGISTAREHLAAASQFRSALDERDSALLDYAASTLAERPDFDEMVRRIRSAAERYDEDAEIAYLLACALHSSGKRAEARAEAKRAHELDPHFAAALWILAEVDQQTDPDGALATLARCLELSPTAASCLRVRATIHAKRGQCEELETDARRMTVVEPKGPRAYEFLALALASRGAPVDAVREALDKRIPLEPDPATSQKAKVQEAVWTALLVGDLTQAEAGARELDKLAEGNLSESEHGTPLEYLLDVLEERGERAKMLDAVDAFDRRSNAWTHDDVLAPLRIAIVRRHAGRIDAAGLAKARAESERRIEAFAPGALPGLRWLIEYAAFAEGPAEVAEALDALPDGGLAEIDNNDVFAGQLYLRGGQPERARPFLESASACCSLIPTEEARLADTILNMRAHVMLGQAREQTGDKRGACGAYAFVIEHWRNAKPRSVTLEKAKERVKALVCGG